MTITEIDCTGMEIRSLIEVDKNIDRIISSSKYRLKNILLNKVETKKETELIIALSNSKKEINKKLKNFTKEELFEALL